MAIRSFRHKGLKRLFDENATRGIPAQQADKLRDMLAAIDAAVSVQEIALFPG